MTYEMSDDSTEAKASPGAIGPVSRSEQAVLDELVEVLSTRPGGLRRWSVMRAIRASRSRRGQDIPQKFEDEVERAFRRHCADAAETRSAPPGRVLFYRPKETAGEVWALLQAAPVT